MSSAADSRRSDPRYEIRGDRALAVCLQRRIDGRTEPISGLLIDLSCGGAKIATDGPLPIREVVVLQLDADDVELHLEAAATVCWARPKEDGRWWIGLSLDEAVTEDTLNRLAAGCYIDRRGSPRYAATVAGTARWELSTKPVTVQITNYSVGGFCLESPEAPPEGARVMLSVGTDTERPVTIPARVCWVRARESGHTIGCSFSNNEGFSRLRRFMPALERKDEEKPMPVAERSRRKRFALVALGIALAFGVSLLLRQII